jgi:hypothetical protein
LAHDGIATGSATDLARRFEFHYTPPKQGSLLNMTEAELSVLSKQCLDHRLADRGRLAAETASRDRDRVQIHWRFTIHDARRRLTHLYPAQLPW